MGKQLIGALIGLSCCCSAVVPAAAAEEQKYELRSPAATVKDVLSENLGKRVLVRLESGESIEGTVMKVGDSVVHLARISGRDFFDAVVRMDRISAVMFKVRG